MYDLDNLGWHSFQELCLTITREILGQTVASFLVRGGGWGLPRWRPQTRAKMMR